MDEVLVRALKEHNCSQVIECLSPLIYKNLQNVSKLKHEEFKQEYYLAIVQYMSKFNGKKEE